MPGLFRLESAYEPAGDQPGAIERLIAGVRAGMEWQTLLGVTGSGKTYTMARVIEALERPALVVSHNKTLAAQLYGELRGFFPDAAVEYFVSYYDYYQPEAYLPAQDMYIEKDADLNDELDRLRLKATTSLLSRRDVIVVASVSCIYGLGNPASFRRTCVQVERGQTLHPERLLARLVSIQYERNDVALTRGRFRVRGDVVDVVPSYSDTGIRIEFFGNEVESIRQIDHFTGALKSELPAALIYPAKHFVTTEPDLVRAMALIEEELAQRLAHLRAHGRMLEAQRLESRTKYDLELLGQTGYCPGIENYSRHLSGRVSGERPSCLLDYFPPDRLVFIDESHRTIPQIRGMFHGDRSRKETLVEHGFRLPSALDNRPLYLEEFESVAGQKICMSATPSPYELERSAQVVELIARPTGLVDPEIVVRPASRQVDDLLEECRRVIADGGRVLVTTLTKKTAEHLAAWLAEAGIEARYVHSEIDAFERVSILRDLRLAEFDVLVGVNLLREGLDLPEVSLVAILDADKEGFLRSRTSLVQTAGRAARNLAGRVLLYADEITDSMREAMEETSRRRDIQLKYNEEHGVVPRTMVKTRAEILQATSMADSFRDKGEPGVAEPLPGDPAEAAGEIERRMLAAASRLDFEEAARLRDLLRRLTRPERG
ncbi:excinuclease ABC subunit UvrB [Candidatus Fermentibacteria bacterium]|nr:excinuclease ABC subunit UvrB [Candidatus Fermentibacteria bacterium]